ncbi:MAG TPA: hypothetical protein VFS52_11580 [Steroidobacteraceae bacterium]|jgi:hypothetical protein|nr:hypothetical protein [Steroidobacteraceae bacterium]
MNPAPGLDDVQRLQRISRAALIVGAVCLLPCALIVVIQHRTPLERDVIEGYLIAWWFFAGISLGSLATIMVHHLTGGRWGRHVGPPLEGAIRALPLLAVLFVPLLFGVSELYPWADPKAVLDPSVAETVRKKSWYLNEQFFLLRAAIYFTAWLLIAARLGRAWARYGADTPPAEQLRLRVWSTVGLLIYAVTVTFAAVDWIMSLVPQWYSTTFGLLTGVGQSLSGFAFGIVGASLLPQLRARAQRAPPHELNDLGNLMLMFVMLWAYLAYTEYLIIWAEDLRHENAWHLPRIETSWRWVGVFLIVFEFALPFFVLLFRDAKRRVPFMLALGCGLLFAHWVDSVWVVSPSLHPQGITLHWPIVVASLGVGGLWLANVAWLVAQGPSVASAELSDTPEAEHG